MRKINASGMVCNGTPSDAGVIGIPENAPGDELVWGKL
jgi:hypothetical protein